MFDPDNNLWFYQSEYNADNLCKYYSISSLPVISNPELNISIINYNIRSFHQNFETFEPILNLFDNPVDILVFSETWNNLSNFQLCKVQNYNSIHTMRENMRGGGVSIFCSNKFVMEKVDELSWCNSSIESCVGKITMGNKYIFIIAIYRPHSDSIENFTSIHENLLNSIILKDELIILVGDMNNRSR